MTAGAIRVALTPSDLKQYLKVLDIAGQTYDFVAWTNDAVKLANLQLRLRTDDTEPGVGLQLCLDGTWSAWADLPVGGEIPS